MTDAETSKKKRGGRPRKHPVGTRVPTLAFRVRAGLRDKLEESAKANERSISEEIERRLEETYARSGIDPDTMALAEFVARVVMVTQAVPAEVIGNGANWMNHTGVARYCYKRVALELARYMRVEAVEQLPEGSREWASRIDQKAVDDHEADRAARAEWLARTRAEGGIFARLLALADNGADTSDDETQRSASSSERPADR